jgi:hypothetical protein
MRSQPAAPLHLFLSSRELRYRFRGANGQGAGAGALWEKLGVQRVEREDSHIAELAAALEYMPLTIVQAAAYISQLLRTEKNVTQMISIRIYLPQQLIDSASNRLSGAANFNTTCAQV